VAYTPPNTVTGSDTLTAALWNQQIRDNFSFLTTLQFTNEAARDAAITAPIAGMQVRLTAPTVNTAISTLGSSALTSIASGITTTYDGTRWVCTTPVSAVSTGNSVSYSSASWTKIFSGQLSVTVVTGSRVLISLSAGLAWVSSSGVVYGGVNANTTPSTLPFVLSGPGNVSYQYIASVTPGVNTFELYGLTSAGTGLMYGPALTVTALA
jgi:hypothetical protein